MKSAILTHLASDLVAWQGENVQGSNVEKQNKTVSDRWRNRFFSLVTFVADGGLRTDSSPSTSGAEDAEGDWRNPHLRHEFVELCAGHRRPLRLGEWIAAFHRGGLRGHNNQPVDWHVAVTNEN